MAKRHSATTKSSERAQKPRGTAFKPTRAQRAFVMAAAGLGVPDRIICRMLPGGRSGEAPEIDGRALRAHFARERTDGLKLAVALAEARLFQRALAGEDRSALAAQTLILKMRGTRSTASEPPGADAAEPELLLERLSPEERDTLRKLLEKAMAADDAEA